MKSIYVDWSENFEDWYFPGRELVFTEKELYDNPDLGIPIMNYAYPLEFKPSDKAIKKVITETNCTVAYNEKEDSYYLALTGAGMDFSQDIALAYIYAQGFIDWDLLSDIYITNPLSVNDKKFRLLTRHLSKQLKVRRYNDLLRLKEIAKAREALR